MKPINYVVNDSSKREDLDHSLSEVDRVYIFLTFVLLVRKFKELSELELTSFRYFSANLHLIDADPRSGKDTVRSDR